MLEKSQVAIESRILHFPGLAVPVTGSNGDHDAAGWL